MIERRISRLMTGLLLLAVAFIAGCETGFIQEAARASLASFLTNVANTVVNETVGP